MKDDLSSKATLFKLKNSIAKSSDKDIQAAFEAFLNQPESYKNKYHQAHFNCAFDGYSFLGQEDSLNQYSTDLLHSFVLSKYSALEKFPKEFHSFLKTHWDTTIQKVKTIEREVISQLQIPELETFYEKFVGHMVSCNFYPPVDETIKSELRLSKHVDVSLFTVFVYGASNGFSYENEFGDIEPLTITNDCVVFPGYLLEFLTRGKFKALQHQVDLPKTNDKRYSFAFFSIPKPNQEMTFNDVVFSSESYYKEYLALF